jgi:hypothetical protein
VVLMWNGIWEALVQVEMGKLIRESAVLSWRLLDAQKLAKCREKGTTRRMKMCLCVYLCAELQGKKNVTGHGAWEGGRKFKILGKGLDIYSKVVASVQAQCCAGSVLHAAGMSEDRNGAEFWGLVTPGREGIHLLRVK